jgi:hypothetical protein
MARRSAVLVAWSVAALYWVPTTASFALRALNDPAYSLADGLSWRLAYGIYPTVGAVIVARQPRNRIGWLCCAIGLLIGPAAFAQEYAWYTLVHRPGALPGGLAMGWLGSWPWYPAIILALIGLPLLFPNGRLASRRWRPVALAAVVIIVTAVVWAMFAPRQLEGSPDLPPNPLGVRNAAALFDWLEAAMPVALVGVVLLSAASMIARFRRSRGEERQQLKWFTYGAALAALLYACFIATDVHLRLPLAVSLLVTGPAIVAIPAAIGIAVLRYRLYDIDRLINRTLVYGLLTVVLGVVYAGMVLAFGQLAGGIGTDPPSWAVAGATLAVAALFQPARRRTQALVDRRFNRRKYDAAKTVEAFGARLRDEIDLDTLLAELLAVVGQTMEPTQVSLWLRPATNGSRNLPRTGTRPTSTVDRRRDLRQASATGSFVRQGTSGTDH